MPDEFCLTLTISIFRGISKVVTKKQKGGRKMKYVVTLLPFWSSPRAEWDLFNFSDPFFRKDPFFFFKKWGEVAGISFVLLRFNEEKKVWKANSAEFEIGVNVSLPVLGVEFLRKEILEREIAFVANVGNKGLVIAEAEKGEKIMIGAWPAKRLEDYLNNNEYEKICLYFVPSNGGRDLWTDNNKASKVIYLPEFLQSYKNLAIVWIR